MSVMWQLLYVNHYFLQSELTDNDDTIIDEDPAEKTADITEEQNELTVLEKSIDKTIELHESEETSNEKEKATCVDDEPNKNVVVDDDVNDPEVNKQLTGSVDGAPLASMESDPAPLASLESSTTAEMPSM